MLKKTLIYLGLGPDEEYDSFDDYAPTDAGGPAAPVQPSAAQPQPRQYQQPPQRQPQPARPTMRAVPSGQDAGSATVRPIRSADSQPSGSVRAIPSSAPQQPTSEPAPKRRSKELQPAVRIVESRSSSPHALGPTSFNDAQAIGDRFKAGQAVIVNLQGADRDLRRRLVDFASGLCYGLGGKMDRVADQVYLLTPDDVVVSAADTQRALD